MTQFRAVGRCIVSLHNEGTAPGDGVESIRGGGRGEYLGHAALPPAGSLECPQCQCRAGLPTPGFGEPASSNRCQNTHTKPPLCWDTCQYHLAAHWRAHGTAFYGNLRHIHCLRQDPLTMAQERSLASRRPQSAQRPCLISPVMPSRKAVMFAAALDPSHWKERGSDKYGGRLLYASPCQRSSLSRGSLVVGMHLSYKLHAWKCSALLKPSLKTKQCSKLESPEYFPQPL